MAYPNHPKYVMKGKKRHICVNILTFLGFSLECLFIFLPLQILDEVEKRRAISPALVQPFMRGIMEAPFPAPGRTITVKNFLPGSGTEVS